MNTNLNEEEKDVWLIAYKKALTHCEPSLAAREAAEALRIYREIFDFVLDDESTQKSEILNWPGLIIYDMDAFFSKPVD
ncbi:hypothetical protein KWH47_09965 [Xanthomonas campestris pv. spermacoces]|uniref:hypothetical protein n=1 Tax=Xanthomonas euvesicatoria TaxID=456327 RepID=UPI001C4493C0|nr:hypothetical protein [Xanthomonas euvesicatoria]MBV6887868.1 hypothetical protein [Xanthomonas campestris pv. spermacoces]